MATATVNAVPVRGFGAASEDVIEDKVGDRLDHAGEDTGFVTGEVAIWRSPAIAFVISSR